MRRPAVFALTAVLTFTAAPFEAHGPSTHKLDRPLRSLGSLTGTVRVILQTSQPDAVEILVRSVGGRPLRRLTSVPAVVGELPSEHLQAVAASPHVRAVNIDRPIRGALQRTVSTIGARWVTENLGIDGTGVGVAIIDSGVTSGHEDLVTKVVHFADFVDSRPEPHDGYGHGTHVAGIIAGNGQSSDGARRGIAPGAHLVVLRALDRGGDGAISNAIAALDYAIEQRATFNIRVINLSVAAGVYQSYKSDPLTLAARRAVDAGMVVVTAAGNLGRNTNGRVQYGGITAPGNAPWVLTVGASSHNGTIDRADDTVAPFSSLGPSAIDLVPKPDLLAPGVGIESAADHGGTLFNARPNARVWGTMATATEPYLSLSGTSMAAPVVAGTIALMFQANPSLTPAAVKAILQSSAEPIAGESHLAQGAGLLNARRAVELARSFAENSAASELFEQFVDAYEAEEGAWTAPCASTDYECRYLSAACATVPGCFDRPAGAVVGVLAPARDTTVWGPRTTTDRRRRRRGTPAHNTHKGNSWVSE